MGEAFFYFLSSFVLLCITNLGKVQLGLSMTATSVLSLALMVGVGLGSLLSGRWQVNGWRRYVSTSGAMMCLGLTASALCVLLPGGIRYPVLLCALILTGICGGLYLIPIASFIQVRPAEHEKGKILGMSNFFSFIGIMVSGPLFGLLLDSSLDAPSTGAQTSQGFTFSPAVLLGAVGVLGLLFQLGLGRQLARLPGSLAGLRPGVLGIFLRLVLALRYKVSETGLDTIAWDPARKDAILFLPNHPALIDPPIVYSRLAGVKPRPLADAGFMSGLWGRILSALLHTVLIPDLGKAKSTQARREVEDGLTRIIESLRQGDSVLMYPAGRIYRSTREVLGGNSGAWRVIQAVPGLRVVVVRSTGLWGSSFGFGADGRSPNMAAVLVRGGLTLLANAIFLAPRRKVEVEFVEAIDLPRQADKKALNNWLENFYNREAPPPMGVPHFFWQGSKPYPLPTGNADIGRFR